jgi:transposase
MINEEKIDLKKATYEQLCLVWKQIVVLKKKGYTEVQIRDITGMAQYRINQIWQMYKADGKIPKPKKRGRKVGEKKLLSPEQEKGIKRIIIDKNPDQMKLACFLWTINTVRELIKQKYDIQLGKETVREYLESWGMSSQRPSKQAYKQDEKAVERFKNEVYPEIKKRAKAENAEIYFGDETGINNQAYNPRGYAPKGQTPVVKVEVSRKKVNMMSAVSPSGHHKFKLYEDSTTQQKLIEFMAALVKDKRKKKIFLIIDNLKVHHGKLVLEWLEEHKDEIEVFYFPSYSPEINPDEYLNQILKQDIHHGIPPRDEKQITKKILCFMECLSTDMVKMIFHHPKLAYQKNFA